MERIKLGEVGDNEVFAISKGFDTVFEISSPGGVTNRYESLEDFADDIMISARKIGYFRLETIAINLLEGIDPKLDDYEKEILLGLED